MSVRSNIVRTAGWFRNEGKTFSITVLDDTNQAVNLSTTNLKWYVLKEQGSRTKYLELDRMGSLPINGTIGGLAVSGVGNNVVVVSVAFDDYDDLPAGNHYHELWDTDNNLLLSYGDAYLHNSRGAVIV